MKILSFNAQDEKDFCLTAWHEAGHAVVARAYALNPTPFVGGLHMGVCASAAGTREQNAALAWGGILGEVLGGFANPVGEPLTVPTWWHHLFMAGGHAERLSAEDRELIQADSFSLESFRRAFDILTARRPELEAAAARLIAQSRETVLASRGDRDRGNQRVEHWIAARQELRDFLTAPATPVPEVPDVVSATAPAPNWGITAHGLITTDVICALDKTGEIEVASTLENISRRMRFGAR
ncbi:MAG TPA: hypothetical protein VG167_08090 [Verrucomicrobiae bacterium]|nr:hypothetical protein [Verrucomicrobiae bacterium]